MKDVGDAIAFTYVDKYDIKPMRFKEVSGFVSGNLTHCLRYGDITAGQGDRLFALLEVKSGMHRNQRAKRQSAGITRIMDYLKTDTTHDLYGIHGEWKRIAYRGEEVNHRERLDAIIRKAREDGLGWEEVERGFYVATYQSRLDWLNAIGQRCKGQPMLAIVNELKWQNAAYYPFTLSIHNLDALWDFYLGRMVIAIVVDTMILRERLDLLGLSADLTDEEDFVIRLHGPRSQKAGLQTAECKVSRQFFNRLFAEFLSLESVCNQIACLAKKADTSGSAFN